jgi:cobalt-zinc-cadmium efflux system protein
MTAQTGKRDADFRSKKRRLIIGIALGGALVAAEATVGIMTHSLALISDAGHNLADILAVALSLVAVYLMVRPATDRRTFGFGRVGILTALANALGLVVVGGLLVYEAVRRLQHLEPVNGYAMMIVAGIAIVINSAVALALMEHRHDLNIKSAFLHQVLDAAVSVGVLIAGIVIATTHWYYADPIIALVISVFIFRAAWQIIAEATDILLESVPRHIDLSKVQEEMEAVPGVVAVHHLHVWELGSGVYALSGHVEVGDQMVSECTSVMRDVARMLSDDFNIVHPTIQIESEALACPLVSPTPKDGV